MPKHTQSQKKKTLKLYHDFTSLFPFNTVLFIFANFDLHEHNSFYINWKRHNVTLNSIVYFRCCHVS